MPRNLYDPVSMYSAENPDAEEPVGGYNVSRPWLNGMRKAAPAADRKAAEHAAMARLAGDDDSEVTDLTSDHLMDRTALNPTQEWALSSRYSPQELTKLRDEIAADPQSFGANRFGTATGEFGGKKFKMSTFSKPDTRRAANWVDYERNRSEREDVRKANAEENATKLAAANVPVRVAEVTAKAQADRDLLIKEREDKRDERIRLNEERLHKIEDEKLGLQKQIDEARVAGNARDLREGQSEKQRRIAEKLARIGREEMAGLEFNPDEQRAVMARLAGADPDLAGLAEDQYLRRPSAEMAEHEYGAQIDKLGKFLEDNWLDVSEGDQQTIKRQLGEIVSRAQADLTPGQLARFKRKISATLGDKIQGGWFNSDKARRDSLRAVLGM